MTNMKNLLLHLFLQANSMMFRRDFSEIKRDVSERSICANLKEMMSLLLPNYGLDRYYVDVEYNRAGEKDIKQTLIDNMPKSIVCDLIIHSRGQITRDKLLCVEVKKATASESLKEDDRKRLRALTSHSLNLVNNGNYYVADYVVGIFYEIDIKKEKIHLETFRSGHMEWTLDLDFDDVHQVDLYDCLSNTSTACHNKFIFHNVGQGLFYSGLIYNNYNFVYDCGSNNIKYINNAVLKYCSSLNDKEIDFLVISHFHNDHISGIRMLNSLVNIKKVFAPYLFDDEDLTCLLIAGIFYSFDNEDSDRDNDFNISLNYIIELYFSENTIRIKDSHSFMYQDWVFKFYNKTIPASLEYALKTSLNTLLTSTGCSSIRDIITKGYKNILKKMYKSVFGGANDIINDTSLAMLHYPLNYKNRKQMAYTCLGVCRPYSLLTGDIKFDYSLASRIMADYLEGVSGIGLIPHHGSFNNWCAFYSFFNNLDYYIVSSSSTAHPRFPDYRINYILSVNNYFKVNELIGFMYYIL